MGEDHGPMVKISISNDDREVGKLGIFIFLFPAEEFKLTYFVGNAIIWPFPQSWIPEVRGRASTSSLWHLTSFGRAQITATWSRSHSHLGNKLKQWRQKQHSKLVLWLCFYCYIYWFQYLLIRRDWFDRLKIWVNSFWILWILKKFRVPRLKQAFRWRKAKQYIMIQIFTENFKLRV